MLLIGSHADVLQKEGKDAENIISESFTDTSQSFYTEFPDSSVEMLGYRIAGNFRWVQIFAIFADRPASAKIKTAKKNALRRKLMTSLSAYVDTN